MNFCDYLEIFKKNNLNQFLQKEKIAIYKQKKCRQIIKKKSREKHTIPQGYQKVCNFLW